MYDKPSTNSQKQFILAWVFVLNAIQGNCRALHNTLKGYPAVPDGVENHTGKSFAMPLLTVKRAR